MQRLKRFTALLLCLAVLTQLSSAFAVTEITGAYETYNYSFKDNSEILAAAAYMPTRIVRASDLGLDNFRTLSDLFVDEEDGSIYLADTDNNRIIRTNSDFTEAAVYTEADGVAFAQPKGVFVQSGMLYVADTGNRRVVKMDAKTGETIAAYGKPDSPQFSQGVDFKPQKVVVTAQGEISIVCEGIYEGLVTIDQSGEFQGYSGTIPVKPTLWELFWRLLSTREQLKSMSSFLPVTYINVDLDEKGFIMATSQAEQSTMANSIQRLNPGGNDVLINNSGQTLTGDLGNIYDGRATGVSVFQDVACLEGGIFACVDVRRSKVFLYDDEGEMLFAFGGLGGQDGNIAVPSAIDSNGFTLYVADSSLGQITVFEPTAYGKCLMQGIIDYNNSDYEQSKANFTEAFRYNTNCELAYLGIGRAQMREGAYKDAMASFRLAANRTYYSRAMKQYRAEVLDENFSVIFALIVIVLLALIANPIIKKLRRNAKPKEKKEWQPKSRAAGMLDRLMKDVDFAFYCAIHPFKGFHELRHEGEGSAVGGTFILILYIVLAVLRSTLSGFLFGGGTDTSPLLTVSSVLLPILLFVLANWCITTLMEGEGSMRDIYKGVCYALLPMALGQVVLLVLSNFLTLEESAIYYVLYYGLWAYTIFQLLAGNMLAHGFTMSRTVGATILTAIAMAVIVFLLYLFFNLLFEVGAFAVQVYREIAFRA
jgi:hypothetical protein